MRGERGEEKEGNVNGRGNETFKENDRNEGKKTRKNNIIIRGEEMKKKKSKTEFF